MVSAPSARRSRSARQRATDWLYAHVLPALLAWGLKALCGTIRWSVEGLEHLTPYWSGGKPVIVACWHGRLIMLPWAWQRHGGGEVYVLMGLNRNGELITRVVSRFRMQAIRGGSRSGGADARAQMAEVVTRSPHSTLALTPDGPHGPPLVSKMGLAQVSRSSDLPVVWASASASRALRMWTWDGFLLPLPFCRVTVRFSPPTLPATHAGASLEGYRDVLDEVGRAELARLDAELRPGR